MGNINHRTLVAVQRTFQNLLREHIQMVRRFIQHQQVRLGKHDFRQRNAPLFAAGKCGNRLEYIIPCEYEGGKHIADLPLRQGGVGVCDFLKNRLCLV